MPRDQLTRDVENCMLGGVCAGIARHYDLDVTVIRIIWLVVTVVSFGTSIIVYIAAWVIMPRPDDFAAPPPAGDRGGHHRPPEPPPGAPLPARERIVESGRVLISHARRSAEEIADIARGNPATPPANADTPADSTTATPGAPPTESPPADDESRPTSTQPS